MKPFFFAVPLFFACAGAQLRQDLSTVQLAFTERVGETPSLPPPNPDETSEEVDRLLDRPLTAANAARIALLMNRDARAALAKVGIARGLQIQAATLPNPEVELGVQVSSGQVEKLEVGLVYELTAAVLTPLRASASDSHLDAARLDAVAVLLDVGLQARLAWLDAVAAQQRFDLRTRLLTSQQASYATAVELSKAGNLPPLALANAKSAVELSRLQVAEAESALLDAREALSRQLGVFGGRIRYTLPGSLDLVEDTLNLSDLEARAVRANLTLASLERRAEAESRSVRLAQVEGWLPHVSGGLHAERDGERWEMGARLSIGLPVLDRAQGRTLASRSAYEGLRAMRESTAVKVRSVARATANRLESARARVHHFVTRLVPSRQQQLEQTVLQYNAMQQSVFGVLEAQRSVTEMALAQVDASLDYWKARTSLELLLEGATPSLGPATGLPTVPGEAGSAFAPAH